MTKINRLFPRAARQFQNSMGALLVMILSAWTLHAEAARNCNVVVDCSTHRIRVKGVTSLIDCGKPGHTTRNGTGRIGGYHRGQIVKNGVRIEGINGMGDSGGGKVFHWVSWGPKGLNDSNGCVHVTQKTLQVLHTCQGSSLTIKGASERARPAKGQPIARKNKPKHTKPGRHAKALKD